MKHSELPRIYNGNEIESEKEPKKGIAGAMTEEDCEFIVEACNNYEKLQQINKELIEALDRAKDYTLHLSQSKGSILNIDGKIDYLNTVLLKAKEINK